MVIFLVWGLVSLTASGLLLQRKESLPSRLVSFHDNHPGRVNSATSLAFVGHIFMDLSCWGDHNVGRIKGGDKCVESTRHAGSLAPTLIVLPEYSTCLFTHTNGAPGKPADARLLLAFTHLLFHPWAPVWILGVCPAPDTHQYLLVTRILYQNFSLPAFPAALRMHQDRPLG